MPTPKITKLVSSPTKVQALSRKRQSKTPKNVSSLAGLKKSTAALYSTLEKARQLQRQLLRDMRLSLDKKRLQDLTKSIKNM